MGRHARPRESRFALRGKNGRHSPTRHPVSTVIAVPGEVAARQAVAELHQRYPDLLRLPWRHEGRDQSLGLEVISGVLDPALSEDHQRYQLTAFARAVDGTVRQRMDPTGRALLYVCGTFASAVFTIWATLPTPPATPDGPAEAATR